MKVGQLLQDTSRRLQPECLRIRYNYCPARLSEASFVAIADTHSRIVRLAISTQATSRRCRSLRCWHAANPPWRGRRDQAAANTSVKAVPPTRSEA
jgi:hypothetical protein